MIHALAVGLLLKAGHFLFQLCLCRPITFEDKIGDSAGMVGEQVGGVWDLLVDSVGMDEFHGSGILKNLEE